MLDNFPQDRKIVAHEGTSLACGEKKDHGKKGGAIVIESCVSCAAQLVEIR
jgi:hypothetical protein